jgi:hypothetical protein
MNGGEMVDLVAITPLKRTIMHKAYAHIGFIYSTSTGCPVGYREKPLHPPKKGGQKDE